MNQYFLSLLRLICLSQFLSLSISNISDTSEIQDHIYCGCSIKAEAKVRPNTQSSPILPILPISLNLCTTPKSCSSMNLTVVEYDSSISRDYWTIANNSKQTITTCWTTPYHYEIIDTCTAAPYLFIPWLWPLWLLNFISDWYFQCYHLQTSLQTLSQFSKVLRRLPNKAFRVPTAATIYKLDQPWALARQQLLPNDDQEITMNFFQ